MAEKFGLDFTIVDSAQLNAAAAQPRQRGEPVPGVPADDRQRCPGCAARRPSGCCTRCSTEPTRPTTSAPFDLLILDEAHHVAPAAPKQRYAVDSQQTKLIRWLAPHFEHRLFLSATPHNGYPESFTALLEIIDDQRFARGVDPDPVAQRETVDPADEEPDRRRRRDHPKFAKRDARAITVTYPDSEREAHALLERVRRAAPQAADHQARPGVRRPGHAAAEEAAVLLARARSRTPSASTWRPSRPERPGRPRTAARRRGAGVDGGVLRRRRGLRRRGAGRGRGRRHGPFGQNPGRTDRHLRAGDRAPAADGDVGGAVRDQPGREGQGADHLPEGGLPARRRSTGRTSGSWCSPSTATPRSGSRTCSPRRAWPGSGCSCCTAAWTPRQREQLRLAFQSRPTRTRCASCSPPTPPARASTCTSTATGWSTTTSRSTRTSWSSGSAASTGTASRDVPRSGTSSAPAGSSQRHLRGRPGVPGPDRGQGRADGGGPRHGQRGPRRGGAAPDARRDRRLRHRERVRRHEAVREEQAARRRQPTCPSR